MKTLFETLVVIGNGSLVLILYFYLFGKDDLVVEEVDRG